MGLAYTGVSPALGTRYNFAAASTGHFEAGQEIAT